MPDLSRTDSCSWKPMPKACSRMAGGRTVQAVKIISNVSGSPCRELGSLVLSDLCSVVVKVATYLCENLASSQSRNFDL